MRALVQRVRSASVEVASGPIASIGPGMLVLLGVHRDDELADAAGIARRLAALRIFDDGAGRADLNVRQAGGEVLCVSQFTLYGDLSRGHRPSYGAAAPAVVAEPLYEAVCDALGAARGRFGAQMGVSLVNDGPVTVMLES